MEHIHGLRSTTPPVLFRRKPDHRDEMIRMLMHQNTDLMDRFQELVGSIHSHQAALLAMQKQTKGEAQPFTISGPDASWESEHEADLRWQEEHGLIDEAHLSAALKQLGFENSEVAFN